MQSQSSPLTMALLNSQTQPYANMAMYDPAAMAGMQRLQLANSLIGGATDASPAYPMQALSRLGQAIVGALMYKQGNSDLEGLGKQRASEAAAASLAVDNAGAPVVAAQPSAPVPQPQVTGSGLSGAVHQLESGGSMQPGVTGDGGAAGGVMQVHPAALADVNKAYGTNYTMDQVISDPKIGKLVGDNYLHMMEQRFPGHPELALAAYNAGPTATANAVASGRGVAGLPPSTQQYVTKGMQLAQGGNVATDAIPSPVPTAPQGQGAAQPPGGVDAQTQHILDQMAEARRQIARNPYNLPLQREMEGRIETLKQQLQVGQWVTLQDGTRYNRVTGETANAAAPNAHFVQTPTGAVDTTGTHAPVYAPTPRPFTDVHGNTGLVMSGGETKTVASNPSGITGNTPETNAMRTIAEIGPKLAAGTATDQEKANFQTALSYYQKPEIKTAPGTNALISVPTHPVPNFPAQEGHPSQAGQPPSEGKPSAQSTPAQGEGGVQQLTAGAAPQEAIGKRYDILHKAQDQHDIAVEEIQKAQLLKQTLHELGSTGPATPFLANLSRYAAQAGVPEETLKKFNLPNGATEAQAAALANGLVMEIAKSAFPQRITNNDLQFAQSVKPNPGMPLAAADFLVDNTIMPKAQRDIDRYGSVVNLTNPKHADFDPQLGSMQSKLYDFDKQHPLSSYTPKLQQKSEEKNAPQKLVEQPQAFREGQTATNPKTGARMVFKGGSWQPL